MALFSGDASSGAGGGSAGDRPRLTEVAEFGPNPGDLRFFRFAPADGSRRRPCVVVLHGCTQTASGYDAGSGWSRLAEAHGFVVLFAQQKASNNEKLCFSWFQPDDVRRGHGEAASIRQMVASATDDLRLDPARIFVCGLSAGGAMANAMLAAYPEVFAGGAVIAGLPYGAATGVSGAFDAMFNGRVKEPGAWGQAVRDASDHAGPWPSVSVWHGTADNVVKPINAGELIKQWTDVQGLGAADPRAEQVGPALRRTWSGADGRARVTEYSVPGLGHGAPVDDDGLPAPFFLPCGLSSTRQIAADFGLLAREKPSVPASLGR